MDTALLLLMFRRIMILPKDSLHPTSSDDRGACLVTLELVACGEKLSQVCRAVVGQRMQLEPGLLRQVQLT